MRLRKMLNEFLYWEFIRKYLIDTVISLVTGIVLGLISVVAYSEALYDFISFYCLIKEVNSIPLIQVLGSGDFSYKALFLFKTNVIYECIIGIFLLGILNLAYIMLLLKYVSLGIFVAIILVSGHYLVVTIMLFIAMIEAIGFSIAAVAGDNIGKTWMKSKRRCKTRRLKGTLKTSVSMLSIAILILTSSSLIELGISYYLTTF